MIARIYTYNRIFTDTLTVKSVADIHISEVTARSAQQTLCHITENNTMMTDYDLPVWFWDSDTTDEDRHIWMTQERCRRQAMRQQTAYRARMKRQAERTTRRMQARAETVNVEEYR